MDEAKKYAAAADAQTKSLIAAAQGQYGDAAAKLKGYNAAVAAVMNNDLSAAKKALAGENSADADYLRAVIATKEGDMKTAGAPVEGCRRQGFRPGEEGVEGCQPQAPVQERFQVLRIRCSPISGDVRITNSGFGSSPEFF